MLDPCVTYIQSCLQLYDKPTHILHTIVQFYKIQISNKQHITKSMYHKHTTIYFPNTPATHDIVFLNVDVTEPIIFPKNPSSDFDSYKSV